MWGLGSIGNALGKIGSGIKTGAQGIGRGVQKFRSWQDEMAEDEDGASGGAQGGILGAIGLPAGNGQRKQVITPGFAGNRGVPTFDLGRMSQMAGAQQPARQPLQPAAMPQQPNAPLTVEPVTLPTRIQSMPNRPDGAMNLPDVPGSPTPVSRGGLPGNDPNANVENVQIPGLPNRGPSVPYSPYDFERFNDVMQGAKRGPDGNFLGKEQGGGFKRDLKTTLLSGLAGAQRNAGGGNLAQMLGGFIGGGINGVANPQAAREDVFDAGRGREMMAQQGRRDVETEQARKVRMGGLQEREATADAGLKEIQLKRASAPRVGEATWGTYNQETGQPIWQRPAGSTATPKPQGLLNTSRGIYDPVSRTWLERFDPAEKPMTLQDAEAARAAAEGSVESIAMKSFNDPGRQAAIRQKLPRQYQEVLANPNAEPDISVLPTAYQQVLKNPPADPSDVEGLKLLTQAQQAVHELRQKRQQMVIAAQNELQQLQQRELSDIRRYTEDEARKKAGERVVGGRGASSQSSAPRAKVAPDFVDEVMNKLGVDRETAIRRIQGSGIQIQ